MKPFYHANRSAEKYGGTPEDYMDIHNFVDSTKMCVPDVRHRALLHSSWGCWMVETVFGSVMVNSDGVEFCPREVAEQHVVEDLGLIPTVQDWLYTMPLEEWMVGNSGK